MFSPDMANAVDKIVEIAYREVMVSSPDGRLKPLMKVTSADVREMIDYCQYTSDKYTFLKIYLASMLDRRDTTASN